MCQAPCWVLGFKPRRKVTTSLKMGACPDCQDRFLKKPSQNNDSCYQLWMFTGKTDADTEAPTLWLHEAKSRLIGKDPDAGEDWVEEEKGATDGWMASLSQWAWVWANSRGQWRTEKPGVLWFMELQRVRHWLSHWTTCKTLSPESSG